MFVRSLLQKDQQEKQSFLKMSPLQNYALYHLVQQAYSVY